VSGVGGVSGGNVTLIGTGNAWQETALSSLSSVYKIVLRRVAKLTQNTDIRNQGAFYPETHEDQFDSIAMGIQAHQNEIDRSFKLAEGVNPTSFDTKLPVSSAGVSIGNRYIMTNEDGDGLKLGPSLSAAGTGDVTGPVASVDNELALFSSTSGKVIKRAAGTGAVYVTSGVATQGTLPASMGGTGMTTFSPAVNNYAQNAQFRFWQRGQGVVNRSDTQYSADRFKVYSESGTVAVALSTAYQNSVSRSVHTGAFLNSHGSAQRFGVCQKLLSNDCRVLRGKTVTFTFVASTITSQVPTIRAGIVSWTGTADSITSDLISSWAATPTLVANAAFVNTPSDITLTNDLAEFSVTVTLGDTFNNLALMIWTPNQEAPNDTILLKDIRLTPTPNSVPFEYVSLSEDQDFFQCQYFYQKNYPLSITPGTIFVTGMLRFKAHTTTHLQQINTYRRMYGSGGTITYYNPASGASGTWRDTTAAADRTVTTSMLSSTFAVASVAATVDGNIVEGFWTIESEL
jgi:hypothetical protein